MHITQLAVPLLASTKILVFSFFLNTLQSVSILFFFSSHLESTILQHSLKVNHLVLVLSQSSCLCFDVCLKPEILYGWNNGVFNKICSVTKSGGIKKLLIDWRWLKDVSFLKKVGNFSYFFNSAFFSATCGKPDEVACWPSVVWWALI